ncbi:MAG: outer membrane lipoprotein-sorting protein [Thermodesulfobacteriota bacterium]
MLLYRLIPIALAGFLIVPLFPLSSVRAEPVDATEVIRRLDLLLRGDTSTGLYEMTITDPKWERTLRMRVWEKRREKKTFIRILSPQKEKGVGTLKLETEMWNYLPRVERVIKIPPSMMMQSWMGSDFTNDDLVKESSIVDDYTHTLLGEVELDGAATYHVEARPRPNAPVVWDRILYWVRKKDYMPLKEEFYSERGELIRVLTFSDIKEIGGRTIPTFWKMVPVKKEGKQTSFRIIEAEFDVPIDDSIFTLRNMKRVR